ncbi:type VI secretion system Vgr family protein [Pseudomonas atagonensis]|uniref:type VI secretion system Vgr family protein n=1 Tax=Pseudomonas atagonensis TaxID=2609964 RepID=UPI00140D3BE5|nr:contractile injection system protein, VgrG/Pvc8 family [Pseudomonas atagonensis]
MFDPVNEPSFRLDVAGLSDPFEVLAFTGSECISEPFAFEIDVLIDDPHLDLSGLLFRSAFLQFGSSSNGIHGQLQSLVQHEYGHGARLCRARLGPKLSCLDLRFSQRIFSDCSVPQILVQVLKAHGIVGAQRRFDVHGDYPARTFCTQYHESDLQFLQRLCAQSGLHYYFEHRRDGHCLVFGDDPAELPEADLTQDASAGDAPSISRWQVQVSSHSGSKHSTPLRRGEGQTHLPALRSGQWLALAGQPSAESNRRWLVNRVEHRADQSLEPPYSNRVCAVEQLPSTLAVDVARRVRMHSLQRAWVVTVDDPRPDPRRSVAVQFDWLYQGEGAAPSHCWLPLAPVLDESSPGALQDGVEVVVSFLEGDPDQPMITGVLQEPTIPEDSDDPPPQLPEHLESAGFATWLKSAEPLLLLCLMPGGGSYRHCAQSICSCRLLATLEQSGGA